MVLISAEIKSHASFCVIIYSIHVYGNICEGHNSFCLCVMFDFSFRTIQVQGNIFVVYNMGQSEIPVGEVYHKLNDGKNHVIRFTRSGANATLQVDKWDRTTKVPVGNVVVSFFCLICLHHKTLLNSAQIKSWSLKSLAQCLRL